MSRPTWEIWICTPEGLRLEQLEYPYNFTVSRIANTVGQCALSVPDTINRNLLAVDNVLEFWRSPGAGLTPKLFRTYFLRQWVYETNRSSRSIALTGYDPLYLLDGRIIAYPAASTEALKTDEADDMLLIMVSENMGVDATDTARSWQAYIYGSGVLPAAGESITKGFAWRPLLRTMQEICDASRQAGTPIYFDFRTEQTGTSALQYYFYTSADYLGINRGYTSSIPTFFGAEYGNVNNSSLEYDYSDEKTVVYTGGQGDEENREIVEVEDTARSSRSPFGRRETFDDARNVSSDDPAVVTAALTSAASAELEANRPFIRYISTLIDAPQSRYGIDWDFGDLVAVGDYGLQFDGMIKSIVVRVDANGNESVEARLEVEL